ncbi:MAG: molybdopterin synthase large subunit MoaE [Acidimicrobiaceae bacterium]|nr:MAG: molybdopterin synthase large subunit MoaE [Acidimicrobiaceae bacterium]
MTTRGQRASPPGFAIPSRYYAFVQPPESSDTWVGITDGELPLAAAYEWCVVPRCGAVVLFSGTVRDHAVDHDGAMRSDVQCLDYEAYGEQVEPSFTKIVAELRRRWPRTGRVVLLHRVGRLQVGDSSVIAVVSAPHRPEAFEAARYAIDALKASAPIWKRETWTDSSSAWGTKSQPLVDPASVPSATKSAMSSQ